MRLLFPIIPLLLSGVLAQDPDNCDTEGKARRGSDFVLTKQPENTNIESLHRILESRHTSVAEVFEDGNHAMEEHPLGALSFESTDDFDDVNTSKWYPQGISSTADALGAGTYDGKDGFIVSWRQHDDESVRVTFIDRETNKYRHVLLVDPSAEDDFRTVPIHAGGIVWYGNTLYVVETDKGIRVFDMDYIWRVDIGDHVGKNDDGSYTAQGYKYVLPQVTSYEFSSDFYFKHSYVSLDRTTTPDSILVGEFRRDANKHPIRMVQYDLDYTTRRLHTDDNGQAKGTWAYCVNVEGAQGAVQVDGTIYISTSNGEEPGEIFTWTPGGAALETSLLPKGPEDLTYDVRTEQIFTVLEHIGLRAIVWRDIWEVTPP